MRMALSNLSVKNYNYLNDNALFFLGSPESGWPTELKSRIQTDTSVIIGTVLNTFDVPFWFHVAVGHTCMYIRQLSVKFNVAFWLILPLCQKKNTWLLSPLKNLELKYENFVVSLCKSLRKISPSILIISNFCGVTIKKLFLFIIFFFWNINIFLKSPFQEHAWLESWPSLSSS